MATSASASMRWLASTSLPFTLPASAARARPAPIEAPISATVTGPGNDFDEPSGRRILGIALEDAYYHGDSSSQPRDQRLRSRARSAPAGHRSAGSRAADRGDLFPLHEVSRVGRLRDVVRQGGLAAVRGAARNRGDARALAERDAGSGRARRGNLGARPGWREAVRRLSADRSGLFPQDAHLSHHARGGAAQARVRARSLDRHEPPQGLRGSEARQPRAHRGDRRVARSRALDRGAGPPLAGARRRGFLALRRRAEPADAGSIPAIFARAGRGEEAPRARGSVRARDAGKLQDLVDLDAEVLDDLGVFLVVAADQRREFIERQHERLEAACVIEPLFEIWRLERSPRFASKLG